MQIKKNIYFKTTRPRAIIFSSPEHKMQKSKGDNPDPTYLIVFIWNTPYIFLALVKWPKYFFQGQARHAWFPVPRGTELIACSLQEEPTKQTRQAPFYDSHHFSNICLFTGPKCFLYFWIHLKNLNKIVVLNFIIWKKCGAFVLYCWLIFREALSLWQSRVWLTQQLRLDRLTTVMWPKK